MWPKISLFDKLICQTYTPPFLSQILKLLSLPLSLPLLGDSGVAGDEADPSRCGKKMSEENDNIFIYFMIIFVLLKIHVLLFIYYLTTLFINLLIHMTIYSFSPFFIIFLQVIIPSSICSYYLFILLFIHSFIFISYCLTILLFNFTIIFFQVIIPSSPLLLPSWLRSVPLKDLSWA